MTSKKDQERLLEDMIDESLPDDLRESILQHTLHAIRRRRRYRHAYKSIGALAATLVVGFAFFAVSRKNSLIEPVKPAYEIVRTSAFPPAAIVSSKPLRADQIATATFAVNEIRTRKDARDYRSLTDDELLALVASRSGLLVRVGPMEQKLIFPNEDDQRGFPIN